MHKDGKGMMVLPPLSLYIHFPWCVRKCPYCDFNSHTLKSGQLPQDRYLQALLADLDASLPFVAGRNIHNIFIGGGTPSLIDPEVFDRLLGGVRKRLPLMADCEITMEANPGTFEKERFHAYRQAGVTRLSLGIQSLNDDKLKALGRIHDAQQAKAAIEEAQKVFDTFNLDLMYALPEQTMKELLIDLKAILAFQPPHLSIYHLTLEANTYFAKYPPQLPDHDLASQMLDAITEHTAHAGLQRYEVSAYASCAGHQCMHNRNYWEFGDYLGIGAGAHGKLTHEEGGIMREVRYRGPDLYMQKALESHAVAQLNNVLKTELPFEFMLGTLRLKEGVPAHWFSERTGIALECIQMQLRKGVALGLLADDVKSIKATPRGFDFLSNLQELFLPDVL